MDFSEEADRLACEAMWSLAHREPHQRSFEHGISKSFHKVGPAPDRVVMIPESMRDACPVWRVPSVREEPWRDWANAKKNSFADFRLK